MPIYKIQSPDGEVHKVEAPEGASKQDALNWFASNWKPSEEQKVAMVEKELIKQEELDVKVRAEQLGEKPSHIKKLDDLDRKLLKGATWEGKRVLMGSLNDVPQGPFRNVQEEAKAIEIAKQVLGSTGTDKYGEPNWNWEGSRDMKRKLQAAGQWPDDGIDIDVEDDKVDRAAVRNAQLRKEIEEGAKEGRRLADLLPQTVKIAGFDTGINYNKDIAAAMVGIGDMMQDTIHGVQQMFNYNEDKLEEEQALIKQLSESQRFGESTKTGQVIGALAEPLGIILPMGKGKTVWQTMRKTGMISGGFGATGYVDKEAGQTRIGNAAMAAGLGLVASPFVHGIYKAADAAASKAFTKYADQTMERLDMQIQKYQAAGAAQQLAIRAAKKKLGLDDTTIAAISQSATKKLHVGTRNQARKNIDKINLFESSLTARPQSKLGQWAEDFITPVSTRIQRWSPRIYNALKRHDMKVQIRETELFHRVNPFMKGIRKLPKDEQKVIHEALFSGDFDTVKKTMLDGGNKKLYAEFGQVRKVLRDLYKDLKKVGYDIPEIKNYFPRIVRDMKGLSNLEHDAVTEALRKARRAKGAELSPYEVSTVMDDMITRTYNRNFAQTSGSLKRRSKETVTEEQLKHYAEPTEALHTYIRSVVADIERRRLFRRFGHNKAPEVGGGDLDASIGSLMARERHNIPKEAQNEIVDLLKARFGAGEASSSTWVQNLKNAMYTVTLGNPVAATTQFGDVIFSMQKNGIMNTLYSMFGKKLAKKEVLGLEDAVEEFVSTKGSKKVLDWALKWGGFKKVDRLGKETLMTASLRKYRKMAQKNPEKLAKEWAPYFEGETGQLIKDLNSKTLTPNVKLLLWHELSGVQPIALSEMPAKYLQHPDGRLLYMLRTFTIKQLDFMRREIWNLARKGHYAKAATNGAKFAGLFVLGNSTVDAFKDFMQGKEINLEDSLVDNAWTLLGINKFTVDSATRQGPGRAAVDFIAPPLTVFDDAWRGIEDPKRLWNLLPPYGKLIKGWSSHPRDEYFESLDLGKFEPSELE